MRHNGDKSHFSAGYVSLYFLFFFSSIRSESELLQQWKKNQERSLHWSFNKSHSLAHSLKWSYRVNWSRRHTCANNIVFHICDTRHSIIYYILITSERRKKKTHIKLRWPNLLVSQNKKKSKRENFCIYLLY